MAKKPKKKTSRFESVIMKLIEAINGNRECLKETKESIKLLHKSSEKNLQGIEILRKRVDKMVDLLEIPPPALMTEQERKKAEETPSYIG